ncbi:kugelei [Carabus blaptoides fortunei]
MDSQAISNLTVQAVDQGTQMSSVASVIVNVQDIKTIRRNSNRNITLFVVPEIDAINTDVIRVLATSKDTRVNADIYYSIVGGNEHNKFKIDNRTGVISIAEMLDYERAKDYFLTIQVTDGGSPPLSNRANVNITATDSNDNAPVFMQVSYSARIPEDADIGDKIIQVNIEIFHTNDNPPLFSQSNYTTIVQEDKPLDYQILKFTVTDADAPPNGAPYTFDFRSGNDGGIVRLEQDRILRTATKFNHRVKDIYLLNIRAFDNDTRPLYSDTWVVVKVVEESQYPPVTHPLEISINRPSWTSTRAVLLEKSILSTRINGKYYTHTIVNVTIEVITEDMLDNSVVVRFREVTQEAFILSHCKGFVRAVRSAMNSRLKDVVIISVQPSNDDIHHGLPSRSTRQIVSRDLDATRANVPKDSRAYRVDYNMLEAAAKALFGCLSVYVSDGRWHQIRLERDKHSARLTVDNIHVTHGSALCISDILNLQNDNMYFGADVHQHPSILGFEDIQRGFSGCMDDVRVSRVLVPLHMSGDSSIAVLMRFANVEFSCDITSVLVPPGPCGSQPCMNGGTCLETSGGYGCLVSRSFKGLLCELDQDGPMSPSQPCLFGGKCSTTGRTCSILLSQPASFLNISLMELSVIIGGVTGIILLIIFIFIIRKCCMRRRQARVRIINETRKEPVLLNSARPHELTELKRSSKLSNLERDAPAMPPRPVSYTPSSQNEPTYNWNSAMLNNLDTLRMLGPMDSSRGIEMLNEDLESEYVAESECEPCPFSPRSIGLLPDVSVSNDALLNVDNSIFAIMNVDNIEQAYWNSHNTDNSNKVASTKNKTPVANEKNKGKYNFGKRKRPALSRRHKQVEL